LVVAVVLVVDLVVAEVLVVIELAQQQLIIHHQ
jgi:hypothetical protein